MELGTASLRDEFHHGPDVLTWSDDHRFDHRLLEFDPLGSVRKILRGANFEHLIGHVSDSIGNRWRSCDEIEVVFPLQALTNDLHVQQAEKSHPEAKSQRPTGFRFPDQRGVVQAQLVQRFSKPLEVVSFRGKQTREHHRVRLRVPREWFDVRPGPGDRVSDAHPVDLLDPRDQIADLSGRQLSNGSNLRGQHADLIRLVLLSGCCETDGVG